MKKVLFFIEFYLILFGWVSANVRQIPLINKRSDAFTNIIFSTNKGIFSFIQNTSQIGCAKCSNTQTIKLNCDDTINNAPGKCPAPIQLTASNITAHSADLGWNSITTSFDIAYGPIGFTPGNPTIAGVSNPYQLTGLDANTSYVYYVRSICGTVPSFWMGPLTFTTLCDPIMATFLETFETNPQCWTTSGVNFWSTYSGASGYGSGNGCAYANFFNINNTAPFYYKTPLFNSNSLIAPMLSFDFAYATYTNETDSMKIYYSTDGGISMSLLKAYNGGPTGSMNTGGITTLEFIPTASQWSSDSIILPAGINMILFAAISAYGNNLYIDNIKLYEQASKKTLNLKVMLEGLYNGIGGMNKAKGIDMSGHIIDQFPDNISDQMSIELHNAAPPYGLAYEFSPVSLNIDGSLTINSINEAITGYFYIVIKHRNSIETWSAIPIDFSGQGPFNYDFSTSASKAYGDNQKLMTGSVYAIYGGNVTQDLTVDASDLAAVDNAVTILLNGYYPEDINGDGTVDASDMALIDNNVTRLISINKP